MPPTLKTQAERFYEVFAELVRGFQFRDREGICCHGLSVSGCYTLDALKRHGATAMKQLASQMYLEVSTMTRVVDQLVTAELAERVADPDDRRVCRVQITRKGRNLLAKIRREIINEHEMVLRNVAPASREAVIAAMADLHSAFLERRDGQACACESKKRA